MIVNSFRKNVFKVIMAVMAGMAKSFGMNNYQENHIADKKIESNK